MLAVTDLLIRKIDPKLKRELEKRARASGRSLSEETKAVLGEAVRGPVPPVKMGTLIFSLLEEEYRGDDLVFERNDLVRPPPTFE
jgi:plasmid stability protein